MFRKMTVIGMLAMVLGVVCTSGLAMDYANMSNDELAELRGAIVNAPESERKAFQAEWENRLRSMSEEENKRYAEQAAPDSAQEQEGKQPYIQGRGYEQGMGTVIHGGGPLPPGVFPEGR